ncbi:hypothetical protein CRG98_028881 [Punica granatum]|uniref:Uncharacterized protein n=1 Tax=Punica granatum TaxID=22663 RepID=A0A2I0J3D0_PUNGR|nr:hypothetical protein CRG98_028881 [Punica granatum]
MSPSPISSPRTASGSCTPLTGSTGAIPFNHVKQMFYLHDGFGNLPKQSSSTYISGGAPYHDSNPEIFWGMQTGNHMFSELVSSDNDVLSKQFGRPIQGDLCDGQSVLTDRVSRQLLRDHVKDTAQFIVNRFLSSGGPRPTIFYGPKLYKQLSAYTIARCSTD